jgi:hypothetical protein
MANATVPIKFQVFEGDQVVREETLSEPVIKIGKLASSHLRLEEATVSRMHAVIEVDGHGDPQLIDLGSTRGTTVNGTRISKAVLKSGDLIQFGDSRVIVTFVPQNDNAEATPAPVAVAPPAPVTAPPIFAAVSAPVAADVEVLDGSKAIEVQAIYRGIVTHTRHLTDVTGKSTQGQVKLLVGAGLGAVAVALAVFFSAIASAGHERAKYEKFLADGHEAKNFQWAQRSPALDFTVFGGLALGLSLVYTGLKRRTRSTPDFVIGADAKADAPVAAELIGRPAFPLVSATGADFLVNVTPGMSGQVSLEGQTVGLDQMVRQRGPSFSLGERGCAKIDCGAATFLVRATPKPRSMPAPFMVWRWSEQAYNVGTSAALLLFLLMIFSVPPDPKSLSIDLFTASSIYVPTLIRPPVEQEEDVPPWLKKNTGEDQGGKGQKHKGDEGQMGKKTSKNKTGLFAIKGPADNPDPHMAKQIAEDKAKNYGILGIIRAAEGSHIASIFGRDSALGTDSSDVLGGLVGSQIGEAYGVGGLGLVGTGSGGGGTGEGTLGLGKWGTWGKGGGGGDKSGYGRGAGGLTGHKAHALDIIPGQATVRGSLDREIIRRIIRRHINEVKFCYESELTKNVNLAGRISVQFTISGAGQVLASVLQSSTMNNVRVESCVVQAVRRWEFPKPQGGGIVIVSYPFNFQNNSGG